MNDLEWLRFVGGHDECSFTITDQPPNLKTGDVVEIYDGTHKLFSGELTSWEIFSEFTGHYVYTHAFGTYQSLHK